MMIKEWHTHRLVFDLSLFRMTPTLSPNGEWAVKPATNMMVRAHMRLLLRKCPIWPNINIQCPALDFTTVHGTSAGKTPGAPMP